MTRIKDTPNRTRLPEMLIGAVLLLSGVALVGSGVSMETAPQALAAQQTGGTDGSGIRMVPVQGEGSRYWPRWRGPSGQGLVEGSSYPDTWSETENILWKMPVLGSGNSSPVVWGDRIFLTTSYNRGERLSLLAYRRSDGVMLWESFALDGVSERPHQKNGHASATPTTDGERVYVSFGARGMAAFSLDGELLWNQDVGRINNYHGTAGSPLVYEDRIIIFQDHSAGSFVAAFDTRTGEELWRTPRQASVGWGSQIAVQVDDHDEIIVHSQRRVSASDPDTWNRVVVLQWKHLRGDSHTSGRVRNVVLFLGPGGSDDGYSSRRRGQRHRQPPGVVKSPGIPVHSVSDSLW